ACAASQRAWCKVLPDGVIRETKRGIGAAGVQAAGDALSDALDEEEEGNHQAAVPFTVYPCPTLTPHPARAPVLAILLPRMPFCRMKATALRLSFAARRAQMQQCLRLPGT